MDFTISGDTSTLIAAGTAVAALVLGLRAEFRARRTERVRLIVTPRLTFGVNAGHIPAGALSIDVANTSAFPVTIDEVGFRLQGAKRRHVIFNPIQLEENAGWPKRLEPHESVTLIASPRALAPDELRLLKCAYARTPSGVERRGTSAALKFVREHGGIPSLPTSIRLTRGVYHTSVYRPEDLP